MRNTVALLFGVPLLIFLGASAAAQDLETLSSAEFVCGVQPGTDNILLAAGSSTGALDQITFEDGLAGLSKNLTKQIHKLKNAKKSLTAAKHSAAPDLGKISSKTKLVKKLKLKTASIKTTIQEVEDCRDNFIRGSQGTIPYKVLFLQDGPSPTVVLALYQNRPTSGPLKKLAFPQLAFCVHPVDSGFGTGVGYVFSPNPCLDSLDINKDCSSEIPDGKLAHFYAVDHLPAGATFEEQQTAAEQILLAVKSGFVGRIRGLEKTDLGVAGSFEVERDECSNF